MTFFEFGLPSSLAYSQKNITVPRPVRSCRRFLEDSGIYILLFSRENITRSIFRALEARGANTNLPALPAILLQKIKTNCVRMTIGNAENSE